MNVYDKAGEMAHRADEFGDHAATRTKPRTASHWCRPSRLAFNNRARHVGVVGRDAQEDTSSMKNGMWTLAEAAIKFKAFESNIK